MVLTAKKIKRYADQMKETIYSLLFIERQKKVLKIFRRWTWCTKKPIGYRVAHHRYLLTSCPGQDV